MSNSPDSPPTTEGGKPVCSPLCGATKAYGRFEKPWLHEPECPVRQAWEAERAKGKSDA